TTARASRIRAVGGAPALAQQLQWRRRPAAAAQAQVALDVRRLEGGEARIRRAETDGTGQQAAARQRCQADEEGIKLEAA
ncbi:hypothetical protein AVEN_16358-1, partial [Araneus ventricosus]